MAKLGCRSPLYSFGISMLGPALLKYGTEEQKQEHLPKIARGEIRWCQGYSEPNAGSDLASLATSAVDDGDDFVVNGQKVWTSYADKADWIFCLVRTDKTSKQGGISFLLFDMASPGVSTKPILLISGYSPFCETFFDDVRVPKANLLGERDKGWDVAKYLLGHEREMISGMGLGVGGGPSLGEIAAKAIGTEPDGRLDDPVLRARIALFEVRARGVPRDVRTFHRRAQGQAHASRAALDDEICRHRAQQAAPRADDGGGRIGRARMGERAVQRGRRCASMAAHQGQFDRGRHLRGAAQHHRQAHPGAAGGVADGVAPAKAGIHGNGAQRVNAASE